MKVPEKNSTQGSNQETDIRLCGFSNLHNLVELLISLLGKVVLALQTPAFPSP
jgi:hypothetical protein